MIKKVTARVFYSRHRNNGIPEVLVEFCRPCHIRTSRMMLAEANKLGELLYDKEFLFIPWLGVAFGWTAYKPVSIE